MIVTRPWPWDSPAVRKRSMPRPFYLKFLQRLADLPAKTGAFPAIAGGPPLCTDEAAC
jgi:hypothetical protein